MTGSREHVRNLVVTLLASGWSQRGVATQLGISRNTVSGILDEVAGQREEGHSALPSLPVPRTSMLDVHEAFIRAQLDEYPDITAVRLHEKLSDQGFEGGHTIVKDRLRQLRRRPKKKPAQRYETEPGKQGQQDWSPYTIPFTAAEPQTVHAFSLVLGYSRRQYLHFTEREDFFTLIREHVKAFEFFGGVPHEILFDGQKAVILRWEAGKPIYNPRFLAFATHYHFRPRALPPRRPDLKGKVERAFWYAECNLLKARKFRDLLHLNGFTTWWLKHKADVRIHGTLKERPIDRFVAEAPALRPLPYKPYDTAQVGYRIVDVEGTVDWGGTPYSVPYAYLLDLVVVRVTEDEVFVYGHDLTEIARHERAPKGQTKPVTDPAHRPAKRSRYDIDALVFRMGQLGEVGAAFAAGVVERQRYRGRHLAVILGLQERYSADDLLAALRRALRYRAFDANIVQRILDAGARPRVLPDTQRQAAAERLRAALPAPAPRDMTHYADALRRGDDDRQQP